MSKAVNNQIHLQAESLHYLPFLYCTQTILRKRPHFKRSQGQATFSSTSHLSRDVDGVRGFEIDKFNLQGKQERLNFLQEKLKRRGENHAFLKKAQRTNSSVGKGDTSTITGKERQVFREIFSEIASGSKPNKSRASRAPVSTELKQRKSPVDYREIFSIFSDAPFEDVPAKEQKTADATGSDLPPLRSMREQQRASPTLSEQDREHLQKYPERLRKIASRATLLAKVGSQDGVSDGSRITQIAPQGQRQLEGLEGPQSDPVAAESEFSEASAVEKREIDAICAIQMKRISKVLLERAKVNDKELWTACETSVFPLLGFLEDDPSRAATPIARDSSSANDHLTRLQEEEQRVAAPSMKKHTTNSNSNRSKRNPKAKEPETPPRTLVPWKPLSPFRIPPSIPPLPIISTLYPALLLLTLRLLTTHYPFSPYQRNLLPHVRSLGLRSYVLGTSTQLYNTLLSHRWTIYSDLRGMDGLLNEMEHGGVDFNTETVEILERIRAEKMEDELAQARAVEEAKEEAKVMAKLSGPEKKKREKQLAKKRHREADLASAIVGVERAAANAGKRERGWWEGEVTGKWVERVAGVWRGRVMERLRERIGGAGEGAVVEREYASSVVDMEGADQQSEPKVWL